MWNSNFLKQIMFPKLASEICRVVSKETWNIQEFFLALSRLILRLISTGSDNFLYEEVTNKFIRCKAI